MFKTTEQHEEFRAKVRAWAEEVVKPIAVELDLDNKFPDEAVKEMGRKKLDIMGIPYEKKYGGAGLDVISYAIAVEELSRVDGGVGVILSAHTSLGAYPIAGLWNRGAEEKIFNSSIYGRKNRRFWFN